MKVFLIYIAFFLIFSFCFSCMKRKEEPIQRDIKEEETIVMPVSVATDTTVCKMIIEPDTFSVQSDVIPTVLINYLEEDAFYGDDILVNIIMKALGTGKMLILLPILFQHICFGVYLLKAKKKYHL